MKFTLEIDTDNAAFEQDRNAELASVLRIIAEFVENGKTDFPAIRDSNGNTIGHAELN